jgi:hypothetical protein
VHGDESETQQGRVAVQPDNDEPGQGPDPTLPLHQDADHHHDGQQHQ